MNWVVVQLTELADGQDIETLLLDFRHCLGDTPMAFRFPAARDGVLQKDNPLSNYAFVQVDLSDARILRLERSPYVDVVLCIQGSVGRYRKVQKVTTKEIDEIAARELFNEDLREGDQVLVEEGTWLGMYGIVVELIGSRVKVYIELHSRKRIVTLPRDHVSLSRKDA